jgi:transaldolase
VQRVLWASTSTKDPAYRDVVYVEELIGPDTVNTMPLPTLEAFRDHGRVARTADRDLDEADRVVAELSALGIDLEAVGETLSREGVEKFADAEAAVLAAVAARRGELVGTP